MNKKTVYIIIWNILSIYILVSSLSYHNVIAEDITINENSGVSPKDESRNKSEKRSTC
ncbi:MAG: hypothetical protein ACTSSL_08300 [Candidatus Heimdallarchaeaceae archaeon]